MTHFDEWTARVDGHPTWLWPTNGVVTGLVVPRGAREVELTLVPWRFYTGVGMAGAGILVLLVVGTVSWLVRRRAQAIAASPRGLPER